MRDLPSRVFARVIGAPAPRDTEVARRTLRQRMV